MRKTYYLLLLFLLAFSPKSEAQFGIAHEIGFTIGPSILNSDFGERNNINANLGSLGYTFGLVHYLNFSSYAYRTDFFNDHFKIRTELSYSKYDLQHKGKYADRDARLRNMVGATKMFNVGGQVEYHILGIHDYEYVDGAFDPYVSVGALANMYSASVTSNLGPLGDITTTFPKYLVSSDGRDFGYSSEINATFAITGSIGTRYKIAPLHDLFAELKFGMYNSDWVDGLNPNKTQFTENKNKDSFLWFNVGYIFYLQ